MNDLLCYLNGQFVPTSQATLPLGDLAIVRGYGIFDALRTYGPTPFKLREHLWRLQSSAQQIDLALPWSLEELEAIVDETLAQNGRPNDVTIRIIVTGGESTNLLMPEDCPRLIVMIAPIKFYAETYFRQGGRLITIPLERYMPTVKSLSYIVPVMMQKKIKQADAVEFLYCSEDGYLSECGNSNFFLVRGEQLITPDQGILYGITRNVVLELAEDRYSIVQRPIHLSELSEADEAFITSTTKEVMPIVRVNDTVIGSGVPGPHTKNLMAIFQEYVGQETKGR